MWASQADVLAPRSKLSLITAELSRRNYHGHIARTLANLASISITTGRFPRNVDQAIQYSQEAIDICRRLNDASDTMVVAHSTNSLALLQLDQLDNAERVLQDVLRALRRTGEVVDESRIPLDFARVRLAQPFSPHPLSC